MRINRQAARSDGTSTTRIRQFALALNAAAVAAGVPPAGLKNCSRHGCLYRKFPFNAFRSRRGDRSTLIDTKVDRVESLAVALHLLPLRRRYCSHGPGAVLSSNVNSRAKVSPA